MKGQFANASQHVSDICEFDTSCALSKLDCFEATWILRSAIDCDCVVMSCGVEVRNQPAWLVAEFLQVVVHNGVVARNEGLEDDSRRIGD